MKLGFIGIGNMGSVLALCAKKASLMRRSSSVAAGLSTEQLESFLPFPCPVIRIMPNTPSMVGKGCILYALVEQRGICRNSPIARKALYVQKKHLRKQVLFCTPSDISLQLWE